MRGLATSVETCFSSESVEKVAIGSCERALFAHGCEPNFCMWATGDGDCRMKGLGVFRFGAISLSGGHPDQLLRHPGIRTKT